MFDLPRGRVSGRGLAALVTAVRKTPARQLIVRLLRQDLGINAARGLPLSARAPLPPSVYPQRARLARSRSSASLCPAAQRKWPRPASALTDAFRTGRADPVLVTERALDAARKFAALSPGMGPLLCYDDTRAREAAHKARDRYRSGAELGPLDGVPIAIKEEVHVAGLPTRLGTGFMAQTPEAADCTAVARLRAAGAVILGQTPMTEYGLSPLGGNTHRAMPRNVFDPKRLAGGSSTGSAVAVATGVTPVSLGVDGGGSIRIPAAWNGVFGLKPTLGRIPLTGHGLGAGTSMTKIGPIGASTWDLAAFLEACAGPDGVDGAAEEAPAFASGQLQTALGRGVQGLRIGIDEREWAAAPDDISGPGREALDALAAEGAELVRVEIPNAEHAAALGYLTIGLESYAAATALGAFEHLEVLGYDVQLLLATLKFFEPDDYLDAQRLRAKLRSDVANVLREVDVLALPTTRCSPPPITDAEARSGFVDPPALAGASRFVYLANVTGLPAATAPVGRDRLGLPVGIQFIGDAWDEATVLQTLAHLERIECAEVRRPEINVDLLG